ncbi:MAG: hypothetical protein IPP07_23885 [Holophagales bacterium]|nr:hypothetical protein [Holophagales bacterium]
MWLSLSTTMVAVTSVRFFTSSTFHLHHDAEAVGDLLAGPLEELLADELGDARLSSDMVTVSAG